MSARPKFDHRTDPHILYQEAVQAPEADARFLDRLYRRSAGRPARIFREDFCGTAALACAWVELDRTRRAIGVDIDEATLRWGEEHNLSQLDEEARGRLTLLRSDVLDVRKPKADIIGAFNFSYSVLKTRALLRAYVENARRSLLPGGLLVMDAWGGSLVQQPHSDRRRMAGGCTYVWEQVSFDPISYAIDCRIHFEFANGRARRNAFAYDWRLWTLPELRELLEAAGFEDVHVLWEGTDTKTNKGTGVFRRAQRAPADPSWVAYVVGKAPAAKA